MWIAHIRFMDIERQKSEGLIVATAKVIGSAAGTVAHSVGVRGGPAAPQHRPREAGRLQPKHKSRLPRRLKKAMQRQQAA
jgi:hypothetical protein